ncbi:bifunctional [glutamine synthetase] adenylyltransferase/[glutamine synthetase]-adenylyl-L-tyrosine phosphorylase [Alphaproteobacteria bacterium]|nr:bifunctional [glutamine synthetase] adenylyltransferase/[glutamine synthetase]-adenylyl-L-tyrosine phosphorylase [Alphaproteobacteria bacterium]
MGKTKLINQINFSNEYTALSKNDNSVYEFIKTLNKKQNYIFNNESEKKLINLIKIIFNGSPFLTQSINKNPLFFLSILNQNPESTLNDLLKDLNKKIKRQILSQNIKEVHNSLLLYLMQELRITKEKTSILVAICDICNIWELDEITNKLSLFADTAISLTTKCILMKSYLDSEIIIDDLNNIDNESGYVVLALGKLGGYELNYSSDVDLIALYDLEKLKYNGKDSPQDFFIRITKNLVKILTERTKDGYVFRTDFRLRPDAGATPLALSIEAAETYYESVGQNWERAAFIKARPIAGDIKVGYSFLKNLEPFIWRKNLDYAAINDIHSIKRQINSYNNFNLNSIPGYNIKLGPGGIREIELFVQTQQLIAGGREKSLQLSKTLDVLSQLEKNNRISKETLNELRDAYIFYRKVEHRLQMTSDEQTHSIPKDMTNLKKFIYFLGYAKKENFFNDLTAHLEKVIYHYRQLFINKSQQTIDNYRLVFTGVDYDPETVKSLKKMSFNDPNFIISTIRMWHHGRYRATRSIRAREILTYIIPDLLKAIANTTSPDTSFKKLDFFLSRLPEGVQLFSLFENNIKIMSLLINILSISNNLSELLQHDPHVLDIFLSTNIRDKFKSEIDFEKSLNGILINTENYEKKLDFSRKWLRENKFLIGTQLIQMNIDGTKASKLFSNLASATLKCILPIVKKEFSKTYGHIQDSMFAVVAMGTLGGEEMLFSSDLDLIFIYHDPKNINESNGEKKLDTLNYFARLSKMFINFLSSMTAEGKLYEIDMRLRPSGQSGPIATSLESFLLYQEQAAWTWEKMALTKARTICGDKFLLKKLDISISEILSKSYSKKEILNDILDIRKKINNEKNINSVWNIKYINGGIMDCEFIAQYFKLIYGSAHNEILTPNTLKTFDLLEKININEKSLLKKLIKNYLFLYKLNSIIDLCIDRMDKPNFTKDLKKRLLHDSKTHNFEELLRNLKDVQSNNLTYLMKLFNQ